MHFNAGSSVRYETLNRLFEAAFLSGRAIQFYNSVIIARGEMYSVGIAIIITLFRFVYFYARQLTSFDDSSNLYQHRVIQLAVLSKGDTVL